MQILDKDFFQKYQKYLLWFINTRFGRCFFKIKKDCPKDRKIIKILPNCFTWDEGIKYDKKKKEWRHFKTTDFRAHAKFSKRLNILFDWLPFNAYRDIHLNNEWLLQPKFGLTISTFYPDANVETNSVDGYTSDAFGGNGETWANVQGAVGSYAYDAGTGDRVALIQVANPTNKWNEIRRGIFLFYTASIPDGDEVSAAILSLYGYQKWDANGGILPEINIYSSNPASNTSLVAGDFDSLGTTEFSTSITFSNWLTAGYNDFFWTHLLIEKY